MTYIQAHFQILTSSGSLIITIKGLGANIIVIYKNTLTIPADFFFSKMY